MEGLIGPIRDVTHPRRYGLTTGRARTGCCCSCSCAPNRQDEELAYAKDIRALETDHGRHAFSDVAVTDCDGEPSLPSSVSESPVGSDGGSRVADRRLDSAQRKALRAREGCKTPAGVWAHHAPDG